MFGRPQPESYRTGRHRSPNIVPPFTRRQIGGRTTRSIGRLTRKFHLTSDARLRHLIVWFTELMSFQEWNRELAHTASDMYHDINKFELYVRLTLLHAILANFSSQHGLLCERSTGSGIGFGYTMVR